MSAEMRLKELGLQLPAPAAALANYVPFTISGKLLIISGQLAFGADGKLAPEHCGKLGAQVSPEAGREAARLCAINLLAQARAASGSLDAIARVLKLGAFVNAAPDFTAIAPVVNGASDLMVDVFGDKGRHARAAVGVAVLPLDSAVEIEAWFELA
jgi:enamine deaminase RidA (YjgF/YER057c/UK114 family)